VIGGSVHRSSTTDAVVTDEACTDVTDGVVADVTD